MNEARLLGRAGKNPVIHTFDNGNKKATFTMATNQWNKTKQEEVATWHTVVAFGKLAEWVDREIRQGDEVLIEQGTISNRTSGEGEDKKYFSEVVAFKMQRWKHQAKDTEHTPNGQDQRDDLPF